MCIRDSIYIEYGDATKTAIVPDNDYKPMFLLTSTNGSWDYDDFYEEKYLYGPSARTGSWSRSLDISTYGGNQNTLALTYAELGLGRDVSVTTKTPWSYLFWQLINPCGISAANFTNGEFYHGRTDWFKAYVKHSANGSSFTTEYTIPAGTNSTWNSWSRNATGLPDGTSYARMQLEGFASSAYLMRVECADVKVTLNSLSLIHI